MPAYYFAIAGHHTGEKPDPASDTIISIQYQKIDLTTGEPLQKLTLLKSWESSEKEIVTRFYHEFLRPGLPVTHFIPAGVNLDYAFEILMAKCRQYSLPGLTSRQLYYQRPRFDLFPVIVLLNDGRFTGASLDAFSQKKTDASRINTWYRNEEFKKIQYTLMDEAENFLKLLQYLSKYKSRLGVVRKGEPVRHRPAEPAPGPSPETVHPPHQASPVMTPKKRAEPKAPAPSRILGQLLKAPSSRKSVDTPKSPGERPSGSRLRKPAPAKDTGTKGRDGKRG